MEFDLLSSLFVRLRLQASVQNVFEAGGRWAIEVPPHRGLKVHTILKGRYWVSLAGDPVPRELVAGDSYLLPRGDPFTMASHRDFSDQGLVQRTSVHRSEGLTRLNTGGEVLGSGLFFDFDSPFADLLFQSLPSLVVVPADASRAPELQTNLRRFATEFENSRVGRTLILHQLAPVILVDFLRACFTEAGAQVSWFGALAEDDLSGVLHLMHTDYGHRWTLGELASAVGVSRSKLAGRFQKAVGVSPMEYLCRWRMEVARDLLVHDGKNIAEVSQAVGYESESAFSAAFVRVFQIRPGRMAGRR